MAEYIEREKFIRKVRYIAKTYGFTDFLVSKLKKAMDDSTIADVVEVIRCKDCKYYKPRNSLATQGTCMCGEKDMNYAGEFYPYENDFCSYGKKKEGTEQ